MGCLRVVRLVRFEEPELPTLTKTVWSPICRRLQFIASTHLFFTFNPTEAFCSFYLPLARYCHDG